MGDTCSEPTHGCQTIAPADFTFKTAKLSAVLKGINVADGSLLRNHERGGVYIESLFRARGREATNFTLNGKRVDVRELVEKQFRNMPPINRRCRSLQNFLSGSVHQRDAAFKIGSDKSAANGMDDIFMQRL